MSELLNTKRCLICQARHNVLHWHFDEQNQGAIWCFCQKCQRGYSIHDYCTRAGLSIREFLKNEFHFEEARPNEVNRMEWPAWFLPLFDSRAKDGLEYLQSRGLDPGLGDIYYDAEDRGIVLPYYYGDTFVGAQVRYLEAWLDNDGELRKIDTLPGTRLGLLFYGYAQNVVPAHVKAVVVCEGAFNALSIKSALNSVYGVTGNPFLCVATSGCNLTGHHAEVLSEIKAAGRKVILAYDSDEAGMIGTDKAMRRGCITHFSFAPDSKTDWNDELKARGPQETAALFLGEIKDVSQR